MRLEEIELHGFKSFARKTKIQFNKQFSVIVGPNGCGKSNISDAIRWVLGEQSAKNLRGNKMEDVVFSGSNDLKAMNYCKVSIVFDNSDSSLPISYDKVKVSRTVYRTGESKYEINNNNVRLKDITELFLDTGIGKEGYSIISQGKIDEILTAKPEERRIMLDEAAGVSKYKYKRDESLKKLENTMNNLEEVEDLMKDITRNRGYLKKEAEKAEKAISLYNKLVNIEIANYKKIKNSTEIKLKELDSKYKDNKNLYDDLEYELNHMKKNQEKSKTSILDLDKQISIETDKLNNYSRQYHDLKTDLKLSDQELGNTHRDLDRLSKDIESKKGKISTYTSKIDEGNIEANTIIDKISKSKENLQVNYNTLDKNKKELQVLINEKKDIEFEYRSIEDDYNNFELSKKTNENLSKSYNEEISILEKNILKKDKEITSKDLELGHVEEYLEKLKSQYDNKKDKAESLKKYLEDMSHKGQAFNEAIKEVEADISKLESNLTILENVYENNEGFNKSVQNFLQLSKNNKDIKDRFINPLADEIKVKEGYEKAIEYSLGFQVQNIITKNTDDAEYLINILKKKRIGRLTFLPIDRYKERPKNLGSLKRDDYLEFASDVVDHNPSIKAIIDSLLGRTIIVENLKNARRISHKSSNRIVTLDGDIINTSGSIVGGSNKSKNYNLINRNSDIKKLKNKIKIYNENIRAKRSELESLNDAYNKNESTYNNFIEELRLINDKLNKNNNSYNNLISELKILKIEKGKMQGDIEDKRNKINSYLQSSKDSDSGIYEKLESLRNILISKEKEVKEKEESIDPLKIDILKCENYIESLNRDLNIIKNNISTYKSDLDYEEDLVKIYQSDLEDTNDDIKELKEKLKNNKENIKELEKDISGLKDSLKFKEEKLTIERNDLSSFNDSIVNLTGRVKEISKDLEKQEDEIKESKKILLENDNYLKSEYNIDTDNLDPAEIKVNIGEISKDQITNLKTQYLKLSDYDEDSIEEYKKTNEEYNFYLKQKNDLIDSKKDVEEIIAELEVKIKEEFEDSFQEINSRFNRIFSKLFQGGSARLVLEESKELSAGVDIEAKLPGKSRQNLNLLSGGERALIAVSLLFAIFETNPAPFCILDEADAALDESNISKYVEYLRSFDDIQFIIISHRKSTMEIAQSLYGVTMEEEGISKVVNLELEESIG